MGSASRQQDDLARVRSIGVSHFQVDAIVPVLALRILQVCDDALNGLQNVLQACTPGGIAVLLRAGLITPIRAGATRLRIQKGNNSAKLGVLMTRASHGSFSSTSS